MFLCELFIASTSPVLYSYLSSGHPWLQNPPDMQLLSTLRGVCEPLCGSCGALLWWPCRSGSCERPSCGTVAGSGCAQRQTETFDSRTSTFHSWAGAPAQRRTWHLPAGEALVGRCTWSCQECWCIDGHRAAEAAHTHLCLPSAQRKTSTRKSWNRQSKKKYIREEGKEEKWKKDLEQWKTSMRERKGNMSITSLYDNTFPYVWERNVLILCTYTYTVSVTYKKTRFCFASLKILKKEIWNLEKKSIYCKSYLKVTLDFMFQDINEKANISAQC